MQSYKVNQIFLDVLDEHLRSTGKSDAYVCERVGKNRSWISHLRKGKINSISQKQCEAIACVLSSESNLRETERKKLEDEIILEFLKALGKNNSLSEEIYKIQYEKKYGNPYEDNFEQPRILRNRNFLYELLETLKELNYSPALFIEEIVKTKEMVTVLNYDDTLYSMKTSDCPKEYLDEFLKDGEWRSTFIELSTILYCYLELLYLKSPKVFLEKYGEISKKNLEKNLREKTKELLLQNEEYPTLDEFETFFDDDDDEEEDEINIISIASVIPKETPERLAILQILTALNDLNQYQLDLNKEKLNNNAVSFLETIQQNLCCESYDFVLGIFGMNYLKIKGALNRKKFVTELQQLFKKYTEE